MKKFRQGWFAGHPTYSSDLIFQPLSATNFSDLRFCENAGMPKVVVSVPAVENIT